MEYIIGIVLAAVGFFIGYIVRQKTAKGNIASAEAKAEKILTEAKTKQTEILLHAQEKALSTIEEAKKIVHAFLYTPFDDKEERFVRRLDKVKKIDQNL